MNAISLLVVEDDPVFRRAYCEALESQPEFRIVGTASSVEAACACLDAEVPDVLIVDLQLPDGDGTTLIRKAVARRPDCDPLVVTVFGDDAHVLQAIAAGATGYVLKDSRPQELVRCIHQLREGGSPISPSIARRVLASLRGTGPPAASGGPGNSAAPGASADCGSAGGPLTERESEILRLIAKGLSFAEVARTLAISTHTVVAHVKNIYRKLAVHSRCEAVFEANQLGLL